MFLADEWDDYVVIDCGDGEKYELWADVSLLRPDPQAIWPMRAQHEADAHYIRSSKGGGEWQFHRDLPEKWRLHWRELTFVVRPTGFKHTGLFPEQAVNWAWMQERIVQHRARVDRPARVLNLFAYTGGATLACLFAGAEVVHVDAAKSLVAWAKENAEASKLSDRSVRWIVDDALKFVRREARRGHHYDGILMDPPSYGRGPGGEMWKLEDSLYELVEACEPLLSEAPAFFLINSYTTGLSASVLRNMLQIAVAEKHGGEVEADEIGLPVQRQNIVLPCGTCGRWTP